MAMADKQQAALIREVKYHLCGLEQTTHTAQKHAVAAGKALAKLKHGKPKDRPWPEYVREHFKLSQQRADELISISRNKTTVAKVRAATRQRVRKHRAKSLLRNSGSTAANGKNSMTTDCRGYDPEHDDDGGLTEAELIANAFRWQIPEAIRLANQCAILRDGTSPGLIRKLDAIDNVERVIAAWQELLGKLREMAHAVTKKAEDRQALH